MKSTEFITEGIEEQIARKYNIDTYEVQFALQIKAKCKPFLAHCKSDPFILYRGVSETADIIHKKVRLQDRIPTNTPGPIHNAFNTYMEEQFGEAFRNAMFCTGDVDSADYGDQPYYVFPVGDFKFLWAQNYDYGDLFMAWQKAKKPGPAELDRFLEHANFSTGNLIEAAHSDNEIMIHCNSYYGITAQCRITEELTEIIMGNI